MTYSRHTLCYLDNKAQPCVASSYHDLDFLYSWLEQGFPLVATRQPVSLAPNQIHLAIPYFIPAKQQKIRLSYVFSKAVLKKSTPLPLLSQIIPFADEGYPCVRVYGSYCWQYLTDHTYLSPISDLDVLIEYTNQSIGDLHGLHQHLTRQIKPITVDGEVRFPQLGDCSFLELIHKIDVPNVLFKTAQDVQLISRDYLYAQFPALLS